MEEGKRYVRLGAFVLVTGCVLVAVLFLLGGRKPWPVSLSAHR